MPTYEYACGKCGKAFERFEPMSAAVVKKCPGCGGRAKRLISAGGGLLFKGSGFYITDYRSSDYAAKAKAEQPAAAKPAGEAGGKDTSPAGGKSGGAPAAEPKPSASKAGKGKARGA